MHEQPQAPSPPGAPPGDHRSESDFLAAQAALAQAALARTWARMQDDLKNTADLPSWTRKYPWPIIGIAVAAGFLGATALMPAKKPDSAELADALREALADAKRRAGPPPDAPARPSLLSTLLTELIRGLIGVLQGAVATTFFHQADQPTPPPSTNGTSGATDPPRDFS